MIIRNSTKISKLKKILLLLIITKITSFINCQICSTSQLNINETISTSRCDSNNFCDLFTKICKCSPNYFGLRCEKSLESNKLQIIKGIDINKFTLIIFLSGLIWFVILLLVLVVIFLIFYCFCNEHVNNKNKPSSVIVNTETNREIIIELQTNNTNRNISILNIEEKQFDEIQILVENLKLTIQNLSIKNENSQNSLENIKNYIIYCNRPNRAILSNIFEELENLFKLIRHNQSDFINLDYKRFEKQFYKIKGEDVPMEFIEECVDEIENKSNTDIELKDVKIQVKKSNSKQSKNDYSEINTFEVNEEIEKMDKVEIQSVKKPSVADKKTKSGVYDNIKNKLNRIKSFDVKFRRNVSEKFVKNDKTVKNNQNMQIQESQIDFIKKDKSNFGSYI